MLMNNTDMETGVYYVNVYAMQGCLSKNGVPHGYGYSP